MVKYEDEERAEEILERIEELEGNNNIEEYDEMLNEGEPIKIGSLEYSPSEVLKNVDETAYRCGFNDFNDNEITELKEELENLEVV